MGTRAVSNPIGVILILGITIASVLAIFTAGGAVINDARADAEQTQMENAMASFSSKASLVGLGESGDQRFSLGRVTEGDVRVDPDAGTVTLLYEPEDGNERELNTTSLGAIIYESGDTEIAYQGGGVWERRGIGSRMISPPEYHYRLETLTFPIMTVSGTGRSSGSVDGTVQSGIEGSDWFPIKDNDTRSNPLEEGSVRVRIESRYCAGWEAFFTERSQAVVDEPCDGDETVTVDLTVPFGVNADEPVMTKSIEPTAGDVPEEWSDDVVAPSVTSEVEAKIESCQKNENECDDIVGSEITAGEYFVSDEHTFDDVTFDTSEGDVNVIVDGDVQLDQVSVDGDNNVTLYVRDELELEGGADVNTDGTPTQFVAFVHSDGTVEFNGGVSYTGIIYAPGSDVDLTGVPSMTYVGALVVDTLETKGTLDQFDFQSTEDLDGYQLVGGARPLTYLHVSENPIDVEFD